MYKVVCLIGKSGSGKDTLLQRILALHPDLHEIISYTTRPQRDYEVNGKDYYFISPADFENLLLSGDLVEATRFNNWFYGTGRSVLKEDKINIGVFNPDGIEALLLDKNIKIMVYYIQAEDKTRIIRQLNREDYPNIEEIFRRYKTDENDFYNLEFDYTPLKNENRKDIDKNVKKIYEEIVSFS